MSILTKVMIVLVSVFSLVLSGMVVVYVGSATNYQAMYESQKSQNSILTAENKTLRSIAEESSALVEEKIREYEAKILALSEDNTRLAVDFKNSKRESLAYQNRADNWQGLLDDYGQTISNMRQMLENTQKQLDSTRGQSIKDQKELREVTASLYEKIVQLEALESERRRALEKYKDLEAKLTKLASVGSVAVETAMAVTPERSVVTSAASAASLVNLNALISEVHESLASISIGAADGVTKDMVFHVTRGDTFICDIVITDVDTNVAAGVLELKVQQPKVGDSVSTKLI